MENIAKRESTIGFSEENTSTALNGAVKMHIGETNGFEGATPVTITQFFDSCSKRYALNSALAFKSYSKQKVNLQPIDKEWTILSYGSYAKNIQHVAQMLIYIGLESNDAVGILAKNCPEWLFLQFGVIKAGGVVFGVYPTSSSEAVFHMLALTEATICIVDDSEQLEKVLLVCARLPKLKVILQLHGKCEKFDFRQKKYFHWNNVMKLNFNNEVLGELQNREHKQFANECAMIAFTPGAVGKQKAVMLSHNNIINNVKAVFGKQRNICWDKGRIVSYLPLSHILVQTFEIFAALLTGACVYFANDDALKGTLVQTLRVVKPTMFLGVPQVYEKLQERLRMEQIRKGSLSKCIESTARDAVNINNICEANCSFSVSIKDTFANYIIDNTRRVIGMECCRLFFSGGAPLSSNIKQYFARFNVTIIDIYGLSGFIGSASLKRSFSKFKCAANPIDGTQLQIRKQKSKQKQKQAEIVFNNSHIFMELFKETMEAAMVIDRDSWFPTEDLGYRDEERYLINSAQIKEAITTSDGKKIEPQPIEEALKQELPALSNAMVIGNNRNFLTVLLTFKTVKEPPIGLPTDLLHTDTRLWLKCLGLNFRKLSDMMRTLKTEKKSVDAFKIMHSIATIIERVNNSTLFSVQRIQKFLLLRHDFSIASGELGPSLEIRRNIVLAKYAKKIDEMYS